MSTKHYTEN